ncbi:MAG TPA: DUF2804 family protein [Spirochaetota bacterium]
MNDAISRERKGGVSLCDAHGRLRPDAVGWSRDTAGDLSVPGNRFRRKKWNRWCILEDDAALNLSIYDLDYAGLISASFIDFANKRSVERKMCIPFGKGMSVSDSIRGVSSFQSRDVDLSLSHDDVSYAVSLSWSSFSRSKDLSVELSIPRKKGTGALMQVSPIKKGLFKCVSSHHLTGASGFFSLGDYRRELVNNGSFASFETGHGVFPHSVEWITAECAGRKDKGMLSIRVAVHGEDVSGLSGNAVVRNGKGLPLLTSLSVYNSEKKVYHIGNDETGDRLIFTPQYPTKTEHRCLALKTTMDRTYGQFSGEIVSGKKKIEINSFPGWIEHLSARW